MVNIILYMFFSVLDTFALFYVSLKLFKIDLYIKEIVFASLIMAFFSYIVRIEHGYAFLDVFLQYVLLVCFLWMLFRIHIFYAIIIAGTALQAFMSIQSFFYVLINFTGVYQLNFPIISTGIYLMQIVSDSMVIFIGYKISKKRKGFDFIPDKPDGKIIIGKRDKILFALSIPSFLAFFLNIYFIKYLNQFSFLVPLFYAAVLLGYLYFSTKKDRGDMY